MFRPPRTNRALHRQLDAHHGDCGSLRSRYLGVRWHVQRAIRTSLLTLRLASLVTNLIEA